MAKHILTSNFSRLKFSKAILTPNYLPDGRLVRHKTFLHKILQKSFLKPCISTITPRANIYLPHPDGLLGREFMGVAVL